MGHQVHSLHARGVYGTERQTTHRIRFRFFSFLFFKPYCCHGNQKKIPLRSLISNCCFQKAWLFFTVRFPPGPVSFSLPGGRAEWSVGVPE